MQAAIAALHCRAARVEHTDWPQILRLYDLLERLQPSPIVSLNRAVAVAMAFGPQPALELIGELEAAGDLSSPAPVLPYSSVCAKYSQYSARWAPAPVCSIERRAALGGCDFGEHLALRSSKSRWGRSFADQHSATRPPWMRSRT